MFFSNDACPGLYASERSPSTALTVKDTVPIDVVIESSTTFNICTILYKKLTLKLWGGAAKQAVPYERLVSGILITHDYASQYRGLQHALCFQCCEYAQ